MINAGANEINEFNLDSIDGFILVTNFGCCMYSFTINTQDKLFTLL